ncbi:MAG: AAA family ATPase [Phycisphaerae bacterium]
MENVDKLQALQSNLSSVLYGKDDVIRRVVVALVARGHVLLEDVPGVGKTVLSRALAKSINCKFSRVQLTPDMLPSDILGVSVYDSRSGEFVFKPGPVFAHIVLADEVNRTTPRTQSALLEAMSEAQVSADGKTYPLGPPFMVMATQNPYEFEGTYFLPENQLDRFMLRLRIGYPAKQHEREILLNRPSETTLESLEPAMTIDELLTVQKQVKTVRIEDAIVDYVLAIAEATRKSDELSVGLSPRGSLALMTASQSAALLAGRDYVVPDDVKDLAINVCSHRIVTRSFSQDGAVSGGEEIFRKILETIPVPE